MIEAGIFIAGAVIGGGIVYAVLRNNIKGLKEQEACLIEQLKEEKDKRLALVTKLIDKKNEG